MSNATDSLIEGEKLIQDAHRKIRIEDHVRSLKIWRWLHSFNNDEKGFKVKCGSTKEAIVFCIDKSGRDCDVKMKYWFFRIRKYDIIFRAIKPSATYLNEKVNILPYVDILSSDKDMPGIEKLKSHIFESYELQLKVLHEVSNLSYVNS